MGFLSHQTFLTQTRAPQTTPRYNTHPPLALQQQRAYLNLPSLPKCALAHATRTANESPAMPVIRRLELLIKLP